MKSALATAAVLAAIAAAAVPSQAAAPTPQVVDPKGDALDTQAAHDVVSVLFTQTKKAGVPTGFTVAMTLAGPQTTTPGVNYVISGQTANCGLFSINWAPAGPVIARDQVSMECGAPSEVDGSPYTIINVAPVAKGNTLTWSFKRKMFPKELQKGDTFTDLAVNVQQNEPVTSIIGPSVFTDLADYDVASSTASFRW